MELRPGRSGPRHRMQTDTGWHTYWSTRLLGALCRDRSDLPWTGIGVSGEVEPGEIVKTTMRDVCLSCPVRVACADYALDRDVPALGGFYATVWIPWKKFSGRENVSGATWHDARRLLRKRWTGWMTEERRESPDSREQQEAAHA